MNSLENSNDKIGTEKENQILNNSLVSYFVANRIYHSVSLEIWENIYL